MASLPIVTAVNVTSWETDFVAAVGRTANQIRVVRRCVDLADLLATAATGAARAVVLSANLRRLDATALSRLRSAGLHVIALVPEGSEQIERRIRQLGVRHVFAADIPAERVIDVLAALAVQPASAVPSSGLAGAAPASAVPAAAPTESAPPPVSAVPRGPVPVSSSPVPPPPTSSPMAPGGVAPLMPSSNSFPIMSRIVAVWGPTGAPGRTTVAAGVADEAARAGVPTMLVDADTYGGVIAQQLGMLDEAPGLAAACRAYHHGALDAPTLAGYSRQTDRNLAVLTGISRADRWPELRADAVIGVLEQARQLARLVVVDCGFCLEDDEDLSYDTAAPRRNAATLAALGSADLVLAVGSADPTGVARLVRGLAVLTDSVGTPAARNPVVVMNRLRGTVMPGDPASEVGQAMQRFAGVEQVAFIPYDRASIDRAASMGRAIGDVAPRSPLRSALAELTVTLLSASVPAQPAPLGAGWSGS